MQHRSRASLQSPSGKASWPQPPSRRANLSAPTRPTNDTLSVFGKLQQLELAETGVAAAADDDVVVHRDAERARDLDQGLRHLDVGARRRRVARRVVVHQDDGGGRKLERALDHLARIDRRVVYGALLLALVGDELVAAVEEQDVEFLALGEGLHGAAIV